MNFNGHKFEFVKKFLLSFVAALKFGWMEASFPTYLKLNNFFGYPFIISIFGELKKILFLFTSSKVKNGVFLTLQKII